MGSYETFGKKNGCELLKNAAGCFEQILEAVFL